VIGWIWAVPFLRVGEGRKSSQILRTSSNPLREGEGYLTAGFFFLWLAPGLIIQALVHVDAPGHTLFSVAALCVLGGYLLSLIRARDFALGAAILVNAVVFLDFFPLPAAPVDTANRTPSIKSAILFGSFEASLGMVRWLDDITRTTLKEIEEFTPKDRPIIIISTNTYVDQWFMNWRIGRYYLPKLDFWVLYNNAGPKRVEHVRRDLRLEVRETAPLKIPVFREGRILWLIEPESAFHKQLAVSQKLMGGKYVFYSDISRESSSFTIDGVEIVPKH
jgi:hypothetical protein